MKEKLKKLPPPLRKQALLRFAGAGACFVLLIVTALVCRDPALCWPFLLCGAVCAGLGVLLIRRIAQERYVVLEGTVQKVEKTLFRGRPKAVIIARDGRLVKAYLRGRQLGLNGRGQASPLCGGQDPSLRAGRRPGAGRVFSGGEKKLKRSGSLRSFFLCFRFLSRKGGNKHLMQAPPAERSTSC